MKTRCQCRMLNAECRSARNHARIIPSAFCILHWAFGLVFFQRRVSRCDMRKVILLLLCALMAAPSAARAADKTNVVATTEDLASLAQEIGGDKVSVVALAKGYQDPHFVDPKPSFILSLSRADLLIAVGRELEIGWLPPLLTSSRNGKIQPGAKGYLDASLNVRILEIPTGQITRAMGDGHPLGHPHYWLEPGNGRGLPPGAAGTI